MCYKVARQDARGSRGERPLSLGAGKYRDRNVVERCYNRLRQRGPLALRYVKVASLFQALTTIVRTLIWRP